ncbi:MAG: AarF/ABC1/UbiB kinase family protein [Terracidiphilus sp.]
MGQYLALRLDLLPPEVRKDLEQLFENVRPVEFERIRKFIEEELGSPLGARFREFLGAPMASASIAQVHLAVTTSGTRVAVKVQRPDILKAFTADVKFLLSVARVADFFSLAGTISLTEAVQQFAAWTGRELDFVEEGCTAERLRANSDGVAVIPRIHWDLTTPRVLTLDYIEGTSLGEVISAAEREDTDWLRTRLPGVDLADAFHDLAQTCLRQIFIDGFFHGDPHPGNILITRAGQVAFVDYGIFGELTVRERQLLREYLANLLLGRVEESFQSYSQLFSFHSDSDYQGFRRGIIRVLREWYALASNPAVPYQERLAGKFSDRISAVVRSHRVGMNMDLLLFWRTFIVLDAVASHLSSRVDLNAEMIAFFSKTETEGLMSPTAIRAAKQTARIIVSRPPWQTRLIDLPQSGYLFPVRIEASSRDERWARRITGGISLALVALSASLASFKVLPFATLPLLLGGIAGLALSFRKQH